MSQDLASPEACAARTARIAAAQEAAKVRADSISAAQAVYRKHGVHLHESQRAIENLVASLRLPPDHWIVTRLSDIACDIEDEYAPIASGPDVPVVLTLQADVPRTNKWTD